MFGDLLAQLRLKIDKMLVTILGNNQVAYEKRKGDCVDLLFCYTRPAAVKSEFYMLLRKDGMPGNSQTRCSPWRLWPCGFYGYRERARHLGRDSSQASLESLRSHRADYDSV